MPIVPELTAGTAPGSAPRLPRHQDAASDGVLVAQLCSPAMIPASQTRREAVRAQGRCVPTLRAGRPQTLEPKASGLATRCHMWPPVALTTGDSWHPGVRTAPLLAKRRVREINNEMRFGSRNSAPSSAGQRPERGGLGPPRTPAGADSGHHSKHCRWGSVDCVSVWSRGPRRGKSAGQPPAPRPLSSCVDGCVLLCPHGVAPQYVSVS